MGVSTNVACLTCRKNYYCGYGSYGYAAEKLKLFPIQQHLGHETISYTEDNTCLVGDDLHVEAEDGPGAVLVPGYIQFEFINVSEEEKPRGGKESEGEEMACM